MKKVIRKSLSLLIALSVIIGTFACGTVAHAAEYFFYGNASGGGNLQYMIESTTTASVKSIASGGLPSSGAVTIPSIANGYIIVGLANSAFANTNITKVSIPSTVTYISELAFYGCDYLTSITIPSNVTSIDDTAFHASGLTTVTIPDTVTSLGEDVFGNCNSLTSATVGGGISMLPNGTFSYCDNLKVSH